MSCSVWQCHLQIKLITCFRQVALCHCYLWLNQTKTIQPTGPLRKCSTGKDFRGVLIYILVISHYHNMTKHPKSNMINKSLCRVPFTFSRPCHPTIFMRVGNWVNILTPPTPFLFDLLSSWDLCVGKVAETYIYLYRFV